MIRCASVATLVAALVVAQTGCGPAPRACGADCAPKIEGISPVEGPRHGGTRVTVFGTHLDAEPVKVTLAGQEVAPDEVTPTSLVFTTPPSATAGSSHVEVQTAYGSARLNDAFNYRVWARIANGLPGGTFRELSVSEGAPRIVFARSAKGQLFRLVESEFLWRRAYLSAGTFAVHKVVPAPSNGQILYGLGYGAFGRSTDRGATWSERTMPGGPVEHLFVAPQNPDLVFVTNLDRTQLYRSTDGGGAWTRADSGVPSGTVRSVVIADPATKLYAIHDAAGVIKSTNSGDTWTTAASGLVGNVAALAVDPGNADKVIAATSNGIYLTTNGGSTWTAVLTTLPVHALAAVGANRFLAGVDEGAYLSTDGGANWSPVNVVLPPILALATDPKNPSVVYAGGRADGIYKSENGGESWQSVLPGLDATEVNTVFTDGVNANVAFAATPAGLYRTTNGGELWRRSLSGDVRAIVRDPSSAAVLYAISGGQLFKTLDGGGVWEPVTTVSATDLTDVVAGPTNTLYVASPSLGILKSAAGGTFTAVNNGLGDVAAAQFARLAISPVDATHLYAIPRQNTGLFKSADGGANWTAATTGLPNSPRVNSVVFDPVAAATAYAQVLGSGVFKTTNSGGNWSVTGTYLLPEFSGRDLAIAGGELYASGSGQLYRSRDSGATWTSVTHELPLYDVTRVTGVAVGTGNDKPFFVATDDDGLFKSISAP